MPGLGDPIGKFVIGESAIGDAPLLDWNDTILSQYANSPTILLLCEALATYFLTAADNVTFFDAVWNVDTATGWGLDVWGRIVGVSRTIPVNLSGSFLGFEEAGAASGQPWNQAPFYAGVNLIQNFVLSDDLYRPLVIAKAFANICDGSIPSLNTLLLLLFPGYGDIYVTDGGDMTMTIKSTFQLSPLQKAFLLVAGVFPRPDGVTLSIDSP